jgi:exonuclease III
MRLITWNCKGALARKQGAIEALAPDILVVPESETLESLNHGLGAGLLRSVEWTGENPNKGLAVLSYGDYSLRVHPAYEPEHRWVLPLVVEGPVELTLFAVWTVPHPRSKLYVQCLFEALETYRSILESTPVVWAGDFNANPVFDKPSQPLKYSDLIARLSESGLSSLYDLQSGEAHGSESRPTFFMHHNAEKSYHIDFIFASRSLIEGGFDLSVGEFAQWQMLSDHMPLVATLGVPRSKRDSSGDRAP